MVAFELTLSMKYFISFFLLLSSYQIFAQNNRQDIRGLVTDKLSQAPLIGATVHILNQPDGKSAATDKRGYYVLADLPPGSYDLKVTYQGYKELIIPNVEVVSGKETIHDIALEETFNSLKEVVVTASDKASTVNKFATVSARTFSMDEVNQYAGGRSDPARLVANYAGVSAPNDSRNDIVIRGNSPVGILWRIDGMDVTNPNHFATVGTTGGAVSAINTNMLKSSDFFTSAFPAEYGNATSGVFDLGFRDGNTKKNETTLQFGVITGLEVMTEGPITKDNGSSYLIGYRYSLAGLAQAVGINIGTSSTPSYQDLSFKINSGTTNLGKFTFFGILATSNISLTTGSSDARSLYSANNNTSFLSKIGIIGLKNTFQLNSKSYISSTIGLNYAKNTQQADSTSNAGSNINVSDERVTTSSLNFNSNYNSKINSRFFIKIGIQNAVVNDNLNYLTYANQRYNHIWNTSRNTDLAQAYAEAKIRVTDRLTLNAGFHTQKLFLNDNSFSVEPRLGATYFLNNYSSLSLGYGIHSQMQPTNIYFNQNANGTTNTDNLNLGFTKSEHFVLGYDVQPEKDWRIKAEVYYQHLYKVPVDSLSSSYSMLNTGSDFKPDLSTNLKNKGTGRNYGAELTVEKFLSDGYYALFTSSIYQAKYKGSDGIERNSAFNGRYVYNFLLGKAYQVGFEKRNSITTDLKITSAGGRYYTPLDLTPPQEMSGNFAYSSEYPAYFRMDFKVGYKINSSKRKLSQSFALDIQNVTNHQNVYTIRYDPHLMTNVTTYQLGLFPNFTYKIQF